MTDKVFAWKRGVQYPILYLPSLLTFLLFANNFFIRIASYSIQHKFSFVFSLTLLLSWRQSKYKTNTCVIFSVTRKCTVNILACVWPGYSLTGVSFTLPFIYQTITISWSPKVYNGVVAISSIHSVFSYTSLPARLNRRLNLQKNIRKQSATIPSILLHKSFFVCIVGMITHITLQ